MFVGQTQIMSTSIDLGMPYTATNGVVHITLPNGNSDLDLNAVLPVLQPANPQVITALYRPRVAGLFTRTWDITVLGQHMTYPEPFWVTWHEVYTAIRMNLQVSPSDLPDTQIDEEFRVLANEIFQYSPATQSYNMMSKSDSLTFDQAMKWLVSSRMRSWMPKKSAVGEMVYFRKANTIVQYSGRMQQPKLPDEVWWEQGWQLLKSIPTFAAVWDSIAANEITILPSRGDLDQSNALTGYDVNVPGAGFNSAIGTSPSGNDFR